LSIRARLLAAIFVVLLLSFAVGAALATWHAARSVRTELLAALANGRETVMVTLAASGPAAADGDMAMRLVRSFDGSRHLRVAYDDPSRRRLAISVPSPAEPTPRWFLALTAPVLAPALIPLGTLPGAAVLRLTADPANEVYERWSDVREGVVLLALFSLAAGLLCSVIVTSGLRPLTGLSQGLARLGRGEPNLVLPETGPPEIAGLATAFNQMAAALRNVTDQNSRLHVQLATLAEEERAEIARDLHDEVGPLLFAISTFAAAIGRQVEAGDLAAIAPQLRSIQEATAAVQREVRDMLERLHDGQARATSLLESLEGLIDFWRRVRPETSFELRLDVEDAALTDPMREMFFRVAQEGLSNAVRHGKPGRVTVQASQTNGHARLSVSDDGVGGQEGPGLGLAGMRRRVKALGGVLDIQRNPGWTIQVVLPVAPR